ncbi:MAG: sugar phosphate isomerase/epimerase family protein [Verrucomicrobiota bacterium]|nr:sugar phosphate isomerase/epimerase family protein [Verrucomicrobiota bacterium]
MKFVICNEIFKDWPLERVFQYVASLGYDAIELAPFTIAPYVTLISPERRSEIKALAAQNRLLISGIHWVLVQAEGMHLTHPDAATRGKTSQYFSDLVDFCADIGGTHIIVGSPKQRSVMEGVTYEQAWDWATAVFTPSVQQAAERGITICLEPLSSAETNFINTAEEAVRFVRQFENDHFRIILDVKAMSSERKSIPQIIEESWPYFAYFHANDANLKGPGFGTVDFLPIASALRKVGYNGYVSVEVFKFEEGPEVIASKSLEYLHRTMR